MCCFFSWLFHFSKGKGRESLLRQSPVFACDEQPRGGALSMQARVQAPAGPPQKPSSQEGVRTNPSLAKVLWLLQNVRDGRERRVEGEPDPGEGWRRRHQGGGGGGTGRTKRTRSFCGGRSRGSAVRGRGAAGGVTEIRGSAAPRRAAASVPGGEPRSSELPDRAASGPREGTQRGVIGAAESRLVLVNLDKLLAII